MIFFKKNLATVMAYLTLYINTFSCNSFLTIIFYFYFHYNSLKLIFHYQNMFILNFSNFFIHQNSWLILSSFSISHYILYYLYSLLIFLFIPSSYYSIYFYICPIFTQGFIFSINESHSTKVTTISSSWQ